MLVLWNLWSCLVDFFYLIQYCLPKCMKRHIWPSRFWIFLRGGGGGWGHGPRPPCGTYFSCRLLLYLNRLLQNLLRTLHLGEFHRPDLAKADTSWATLACKTKVRYRIKVTNSGLDKTRNIPGPHLLAWRNTCSWRCQDYAHRC